MNSQPKGLDKSRPEKGYAASRQRSTGQRNFQADPTRRRQQPTVSRGKEGGSGGGGGKFGAEAERVGHGRSGDIFGLSREDEETIDGWPRWLVENVPRHVLDRLVPKSADSYEKIDKVMIILMPGSKQGNQLHLGNDFGGFR